MSCGWEQPTSFHSCIIRSKRGHWREFQSAWLSGKTLTWKGHTAEEFLDHGHGKEPPWATGILGNRYFLSEAFSGRACRGRELRGKVSEGDQEVQHTRKVNDEIHLLDWGVTDEITIASCLSDHPWTLCFSSWATSDYLARDLDLFSPSDLWTETQDVLPKPHQSSAFNFFIA